MVCRLIVIVALLAAQTAALPSVPTLDDVMSKDNDVATFQPAAPPTRPAPVTQPLPLRPCPATCADNMKGCISKGYSEEQCLAYAAQGYLCRVTTGGKKQALKCDANALVPDDPDNQCPDVQTYTTCGGCQASCENPKPMCTRMCHTGCFCPVATPVWDDSNQKCVTEDSCSAANACDASISDDYLDSGNTAAKCKETFEGARCPAGCITGCVPRKNYNGGKGLIKYCSALTQATCGTKSTGLGAWQNTDCEWAGAADAQGPTFVCSAADDGNAAWAVEKEGSCGGGGGVDDSVCDFLEETQCLDEGKCSADDNSKCMGLVKATYTSCSFQCFASDPAANKKCGDCFISSLFKSNTLNLDQPDIFSCCGCLESTFAKVSVTKDKLEQLLYSPCHKHSPTGDDDWDDDDTVTTKPHWTP